MSERDVVHILLSPACDVSSPLSVPSSHVQSPSPVLELHVHVDVVQLQTSPPRVGERTSLASRNLYIHSLSCDLVVEWGYRKDRFHLEDYVELSERGGC